MGKVLVAYFSASGTTAKLAKKLAGAIDADLFEIVPADKYTKADLNWTNKNSRSSIEMGDPDCRPAIASKVEDMSQYQTVFVGFPIWWFRQPSIIDTFIESYDFSGITSVPFATSGSSGIGDSSEFMQPLAPWAKVVQGRRFSKLTSSSELKKWAEEWI